MSWFKGRRLLLQRWSTQPMEATRLCRPRRLNQNETVWSTDFLLAVTGVFCPYHCLLPALQLPSVRESLLLARNESWDWLGWEGYTHWILGRTHSSATFKGPLNWDSWVAPLWHNRSSNVAIVYATSSVKCLRHLLLKCMCFVFDHNQRVKLLPGW